MLALSSRAGDFTVPRGGEASPPGKTSLGSSCLPFGMVPRSRGVQGSQLHSTHCCPHLGLWESLPDGGGAEQKCVPEHTVVSRAQSQDWALAAFVLFPWWPLSDFLWLKESL